MLLYLIRHGQADLSAQMLYHTAPGPPLTGAGEEQAESMARLLEFSAVERVMSSPMRRCEQTAEPLASRLGLELQIDDDLGELQPGEEAPAVAMRMLRAVLAQADVRTVALVSHAAPLEGLLLALTHNKLVLPPPGSRGARIGEAHVWQLVHHSGGWRAHHLPPGGVPV